MVDLAGSENSNKSGIVDRRARDNSSVNQSLLTLGRVITALSEKKSHVPFRESKLTRILQDSLGGKSKTSIIATIAPTVTNLEETLSTLDYAQRARTIINKPEINKKNSQKQLISHYVEEISRLRKDLHAERTGNGIYLDPENYDEMIINIKTLKDQVVGQKILISALEDKINEERSKSQIMNLAVHKACSDVDAREPTFLMEIKEYVASLKMQQDELCNNILQVVTRMKDSVRSENNLLEDAFNKNKKRIGSIQQSFKSHCEEYSQSLVSAQSSSNTTTDVSNFMSKLNHACPNNMERLLCKDLFENVLTSLDSNKCRLSELKGTILNSQQVIQQKISRFQTVSEQLGVLKDQQLHVVRTTEGLNLKIKRDLTNLIKENENNVQHCTNNLEKAHSLLNEIDTIETPCHKFSSEYNAETTRRDDLLQNKKSAVCQIITSGSDDLIMKNSKMNKDLKFAVHNALKDTHNGILESESSVQDLFEVAKHFCQDTKKHNLEVIGDMNQLQSVVQSTNTSITEMKHAGDTPIRTNYKYPHHLKDLTPKDKLLSRFRERCVFK